MSTENGYDWVDLLNTAKTIRRSVRPVAPSARFRRHLRTDLACALRTPEPTTGVIVRPAPNTTASIIFGACLGLFFAALALIVMRSDQTSGR